MSTALPKLVKVYIVNQLEGSTRVYIVYKDGQISRDLPYKRRVEIEVDVDALKELHVQGALGFPLQGEWAREPKPIFEDPKDPKASKEFVEFDVNIKEDHPPKHVIVEVNYHYMPLPTGKDFILDKIA